MFNPRTSQYQPSKVNDKNEESKEAVDSVMTDILTREMTANDHEPKHEDEKAEVVKTSPSKYVYDTNSGYFFNPVSFFGLLYIKQTCGLLFRLLKQVA